MQKSQFSITAGLLCAACLRQLTQDRYYARITQKSQKRCDGRSIQYSDSPSKKSAQNRKTSSQNFPLDASVLHDIAQIHYKQGQYKQAAYFAKKAMRCTTSPRLSKKSQILLDKTKGKRNNHVTQHP